ncbi:hypothetical protein F4677DRAFT_413943 [Hypoxylon crocopeplum]|nr:hypothetical protein F4677DRAFT_413943 [Hypoxylon crocopeplum]
MQFTVVSLSLLAAFAAAQNNSTSLPDLVLQLPQCATGCLTSAAQAANCATEDFTCLCGTGRDTFISSITGCILTAGCSSADISKLSTLAPEICTAVSQNPDPSAVASASNLVASAVATTSPSATPDAGARPQVAMGLVGAAALAALVL